MTNGDMTMTKLHPAILFIGIFLFLTGGCATTGVSTEVSPDAALKDRKTLKAKLDPSGHHELCKKIRPDQKLAFSFESSGPLDFNVHYHRGKEVLYPVSEEKITTSKGYYSPEKEDIFCLMWTNPQSEAVDLSFKYKIIDTGMKRRRHMDEDY
jgi:hypothetical protein